MDVQAVAAVLGVVIAFAALLLSISKIFKGTIEKAVNDLSGQIGTLDERLGRVETKLDTTRTDLEARIDRSEAKTAATLADMRQEHRSELGDIRASLRSLEDRFYNFLLPRPAPTGTEDA